MKLRILTIVALAVSWLPVRAVENLTTLLPEETTVFLAMPDSMVFEKLSDHPMYKAFANSELKKIFAPIMAKQEEAKQQADKIYKEETGKTLEELQKHFAGGMAMGMKIDIAAMMLGVRAEIGGGDAGAAPKLPKGMFDMTAAMAFSGDEELAGKMAKAYARIFKEAAKGAASGAPVPFASFPDEYDASTEDYAGVKLHLWKLKKGATSIFESPGFMLIDGTLVISMSEDGLRGAVDRVKKGAKSLADSERHSQLAKSVKDTDMLAYLDLSTIIKPAMNMMAKEGGPEVGQILTAMRVFGLPKLDMLYFSVDVSKNRSDLEFGLTFHDNPGMMKIFAMDGPGVVPNFLPPDADSGGHGTMHWGKMLDAIESLMKDAVPAFGDAIAVQLDELKKATGVDIRKDIIANIGPDLFSATAPISAEALKSEDEDAAQPTVLGLKLKDRKAVEMALDTLINKAAPDAAMFEKREYQGATIRNMKDAPIGFMFTDDWFVLSMGPQTLLEKTITRMNTGGDDHLFALPMVKSAFEGLPGDDDGSTFFDLGPTLDAVMELMGEFGDELPGVSEVFNFKDLPKQMNLPIVVGARQYLDERSMRMRMHFSEKKQ